MGSHKGSNRELLEVYSNPQTGPLPGPPGSHFSGLSAHNFYQIKYLSLVFQHTSTVECRSCVVYAQDNNSLPVWFILSPAHHHISINSQPFLVGIVSLILRLSISGELSMIQPSLQVGNNWWSLMKAVLFPSMSKMVCITWTWSRLRMMIWSDTHMSPSLPMVLGTPTPLMRNSSSMLLMPSLTFLGSNIDIMHVKRLICSLSLPRLSLHHLTQRLPNPDSVLSSIHYPSCPKCYVIASLISMPPTQFRLGGERAHP